MGKRILICGDRYWLNQLCIDSVLSQFEDVECVIEGEANGADTCGRLAAEKLGIPVLKFPANWRKYGRAAGMKRNQQMLDEGKPTLVLAFHSNMEHSRGTKDMIIRAKDSGIPVHLYTGAEE